MYWFLLFQLIGLAVLITIISVFARFKKIELFPFIGRNFKRVLLMWAVVIVGISIACWKPLYHTIDCKIRSMSMKADTKYSWWLSECQIRTKDGVYVPISRSRALPGGKDDLFDQ